MSDYEEAKRQASRDLSAAYLRLRGYLGPYGSFDTPTAPSTEQVWAATERAMAKVLSLAMAERQELRDKFAMAALSAIAQDTDDDIAVRDFAERAYILADAMLTARQTK